MAMTPELFSESSRVIATQFDLPVPADEDGDRERHFRELLISRIVELLSGNTERLMHILYRVDVPESSVQRIFKDVPLPEIAPALADVIIHRQMEKARTRAAYRAERDRDGS